MQVKQVLIVRRDLKMNRGKEIAQCAHASMQAITNQRASKELSQQANTLGINLPLVLDEASEYWLNQSNFKKVTLQVSSEEELIELVNQAKEMGLAHSLITDEGLTYFKGIPTITCAAIGPAKSEYIDKICSHLKLY